jgi:hypothetical protein
VDGFHRHSTKLSLGLIAFVESANACQPDPNASSDPMRRPPSENRVNNYFQKNMPFFGSAWQSVAAAGSAWQ